ncbi:YqcI/YcgG family protein [Paenibacillus silvae]|uniref:YqcI/YcgG family protein n=1 Tax=Paenibacillus silvae TaxID=1325358 RepID=UPI0011A19314|nr:MULTISPECIES: YqcI/YcgG family protein [Paenibacillus]MCK6076878.1 YqcI/YcgG family protein [Paenibacillus silvae]MCK6152320.1 YqcI/YcgG family protein [Paenibacillus silvae]MCK6269615.1 YqcI/YcgG family protein [Paenibacillus silvae]
MQLLFSSADIEHNGEALDLWKKDAHHLFSKKMSDREARFPCIPATQAYALGHLRYGFINRSGKTTPAEQLSRVVQEYGASSRSFGDYSSLVIFFEQEEHTEDVLTYEKSFWSLLSEIRDMDNTPWPEDIPEDPENPLWEFCYNDERYFVYCGTPAHTARQSRHFPYFMLAMTPRWVLDLWNEQPQRAAAIGPRIRARLAAYDTVPAHPELKQYGAEGNLEYKQYFLRDDDTAPTKCPFLRSLQQQEKE